MWLHLLATSSALALPLPTPDQLAFHEQGSTQFTHFSVCTFAGCEQNSPALPASTFNPTSRVDTDQWVRVAQSWGAKQICITAHHSGGFALWQTNFTNYGLKESPYLNGTGDIVRDFVASCRAAGVSPCFYIIPGWNAWQNTRFATNSTLYVQAELNMIRELLTHYGHIDRIWFDFYGMACGQYGAQCPKGSFPEAWQTINQLVASVSPGTTLSMPGTDGCLLAGADGNPEIGSGAYPSWYYNKRFGTYGWGSRNPIVCEPTEPAPGAQTLSHHASYPKADMYWATHEADHTILNPGDHWFWRSDHPYLPAYELWQHWLDTVGRGSSYILNVPPDTSGHIPDSFVQELSLLGAALNASFSTPVVSAGVSGVGVVGVGVMAADVAFGANDPPVALVCGEDPDDQWTTRGASALVLTVPEGETVDALVTREALQHGQTIAQYVVEMQRDIFAESDDHEATGNTPWVPVEGVHGLTVGSMVVDVIKPVRGPARVRWRCTASLPSNSSARLIHFGGYKLQPPPGWPLQPTTWALQTLYSPVGEDMTPCATRGREDLANENRSACGPYIHKPGYKYEYLRDEHCCFADVTQATARGLVPLFLWFNGHFSDHLVSSDKAFNISGQSYITHGPECWGYGTPGKGRVPLDLYWSEERTDVWSLSSNASKRQAERKGYTRLRTTAWLPESC